MIRDGRRLERFDRLTTAELEPGDLVRIRNLWRRVVGVERSQRFPSERLFDVTWTEREGEPHTNLAGAEHAWEVIR